MIIGVVLILSFRSELIAQQGVSAIVEKISGTVLLKQNGKQITLNAKTDIARRLFAGDSVHCESGAKLSLRVGGRATELDDKSGWFVIPQPTSQTDPRQRAIDAYGRIGGRSRGGPIPTSLVYSPADMSDVVPEFFVIRWTSFKSPCLQSLMIVDDRGKKLWEQARVNSAIGRLNSGSARQALVNYQAKSETRKLTLKFASACGTPDESTFYLLSLENEQKLKNELARWDKESDHLFAHLGRASVFGEARMSTLAADEYEAALALAPQSRDLIDSTAKAEGEAGNVQRMKQLEKRLTVETDASRKQVDTKP